MAQKVYIENRDEFEKLTDMGTTYHRDGRIVVATTVGVYESADTEEVESQRVDFVFEE